MNRDLPIFSQHTDTGTRDPKGPEEVTPFIVNFRQTKDWLEKAIPAQEEALPGWLVARFKGRGADFVHISWNEPEGGSGARSTASQGKTHDKHS